MRGLAWGLSSLHVDFRSAFKSFLAFPLWGQLGVPQAHPGSVSDAPLSLQRIPWESADVQTSRAGAQSIPAKQSPETKERSPRAASELAGSGV